MTELRAGDVELGLGSPDGRVRCGIEDRAAARGPSLVEAGGRRAGRSRRSASLGWRGLVELEPALLELLGEPSSSPCSGLGHRSCTLRAQCDRRRRVGRASRRRHVDGEGIGRRLAGPCRIDGHLDRGHHEAGRDLARRPRQRPVARSSLKPLAELADRLPPDRAVLCTDRRQCRGGRSAPHRDPARRRLDEALARASDSVAGRHRHCADERVRDPARTRTERTLGRPRGRRSRPSARHPLRDLTGVRTYSTREPRARGRHRRA